jgi:hypothetical protein
MPRPSRDRPGHRLGNAAATTEWPVARRSVAFAASRKSRRAARGKPFLRLSAACPRRPRQRPGESDFVLRNWKLQGSEDGEVWVTLQRHDDDNTMKKKSFYVAHWAVEGVTTPYRHFRVHQHDQNSFLDDHLLCSGIELHGTLTKA